MLPPARDHFLEALPHIHAEIAKTARSSVLVKADAHLGVGADGEVHYHGLLDRAWGHIYPPLRGAHLGDGTDVLIHADLHLPDVVLTVRRGAPSPHQGGEVLEIPTEQGPRKAS